MADFVLHVGSRSAQGIRPNNEDSYVVDLVHRLFLVADGMGGQERGEQASGMAADIIPRVVQDCLAANSDANAAVQRALAEANQAIIKAGQQQPEGRRMGTTAVLALQRENQCYVAGLGDSRAYLIRGSEVKQLTVDHLRGPGRWSPARARSRPKRARHSPYQHVLQQISPAAPA